jgi:ABC-type multidrug transport system ATPase subunit
MIVTRLKLANLRAIEQAEFRFQPGINLIVGVNGVGKTSVLDALSVCLSAVVKRVNKLRGRTKAFALDDVRIGGDVLTVECGVRIGERDYAYLVHKPRATSVPQEKKAGMPREQVHETPERVEFVGEAPSPVSGRESGGRPLAVFFSTNRAVPTDRAPGKGVAAGGVDAAFADAFANRELRLGEFGAWIKVQESLLPERPAASRVLAACEEAVRRFLPGYSNLGLDDGDRSLLMIERGAARIPVRQLSDGERGTLALVLDLTRRLAQANPELADPAAEAEAIVLIDEIDLHLHPKWQRQILQNLRAAFPRCQFIATTHSPQVIGEVDHDRIQIIADGQVYSPTHSYGVDSSRVLEEVMDSPARAQEVENLLSQISQTIGRQDFAGGRELLDKLIKRVGDNDPEVTRIQILLDFVEGKE